MVTTTVFTGPDRFNRYVALTDRHAITVRVNDGSDLDPATDHPFLVAPSLTDTAALDLAREILPLLAGLVDGDLTAATTDAFYSPSAGCGDCACTPGVSLPGLTVGGQSFGVFVSRRPGTTN